jgi:hypothetical protein
MPTTCRNCGLVLGAGDHFCGNCGRDAIPDSASAAPPAPAPWPDGALAALPPPVKGTGGNAAAGPPPDAALRAAPRAAPRDLPQSAADVTGEPTFDPLRNKRLLYQVIRRFALFFVAYLALSFVAFVVGLILSLIGGVGLAVFVQIMTVIVAIVVFVLFLVMPVPALLAYGSRIVGGRAAGLRVHQAVTGRARDPARLTPGPAAVAARRGPAAVSRTAPR